MKQTNQRIEPRRNHEPLAAAAEMQRSAAVDVLDTFKGVFIRDMGSRDQVISIPLTLPAESLRTICREIVEARFSEYPAEFRVSGWSSGSAAGVVSGGITGFAPAPLRGPPRFTRKRWADEVVAVATKPQPLGRQIRIVRIDKKRVAYRDGLSQ